MFLIDTGRIGSIMHYLFWFLKTNIAPGPHQLRFQSLLDGLVAISGHGFREQFMYQIQLLTQLRHLATNTKALPHHDRKVCMSSVLTAICNLNESAIRKIFVYKYHFANQ
jgi:hypothetical protein